MENETKPQLFIMDERLGDPIPLAEIKEISEPTLDEEYDMPSAGMMWNFRFTTEQSQYSRKLPEESYWQKTNL